MAEDVTNMCMDFLKESTGFIKSYGTTHLRLLQMG